jgi:hypothetical protein
LPSTNNAKPNNQIQNATIGTQEPNSLTFKSVVFNLFIHISHSSAPEKIEYLNHNTPSQNQIPSQQMKLSSLIIAALATGTTAFQPTPQKTLQKTTGGNVVQPTPITRNDMVAIRSPFWHDIASPSNKGISSGDYIVDRDYTVALTLIVVGIWLTLFGPSE